MAELTDTIPCRADIRLLHEGLGADRTVTGETKLIGDTLDKTSRRDRLGGSSKARYKGLLFFGTGNKPQTPHCASLSRDTQCPQF